MAITNHTTVTPVKIATVNTATDEMLEAAQAVDKALSVLDNAYTKLASKVDVYTQSAKAVGVKTDDAERIAHDLDLIMTGAILKVAPAFSVGFNLEEKIRRNRQDRSVNLISRRVPEVIREMQDD